MRTSHGQENHRCPYCSYGHWTTIPGKALGRCPTCKGQRHVSRGEDYNGPPTVVCSCGKAHDKLTARVRGEYDERREAEVSVAVHVQQTHRAKVIADRMAEIEREARWSQQHKAFTDEDWRTHELAIEYRALMREWWTLPAQTADVVQHSPTHKRLLTGKGNCSDAPSSTPEQGSLPWCKAVAREWPEQWKGIKQARLEMGLPIA